MSLSRTPPLAWTEIQKLKRLFIPAGRESKVHYQTRGTILDLAPLCGQELKPPHGDATVNGAALLHLVNCPGCLTNLGRICRQAPPTVPGSLDQYLDAHAHLLDE